MAPKKEKTPEEKAFEKQRQKERDAKAADKSFGLKNKNKSKVVQQQIRQIHASAKPVALGHGRPKAEEDVKKDKAKLAAQQAILAGLFGMATDKKGRAYDPTAKKKQKEKSMTEERSGEKMPDAIQQVLVDGIKNAIRLTNAKGTVLSMLGGSLYVREVMDDRKYEEHLKSLSLLHFIRYRKADFWIDEEECENNNPSVRCQEDVDAANAQDDRDIFLKLEEKRQAFLDPTLPRVDNVYLKQWWIDSARMELVRCPDTGRLLEADDPLLKKIQASIRNKRLTGEQLFKADPAMFKAAGDHGEKCEKSAEGGAASEKAEEEDLGREDDLGEEDDREETQPVGRKWGAVEDLMETLLLSEAAQKEAAQKEEQSSSSSSSWIHPAPSCMAQKVERALGDLPDNLDELDED